MQTNLAATSAARKERLIALRNRKQAVEQGEANGESYVYNSDRFETTQS